MAEFDRFRNLEKPRPERGAGPNEVSEGVAERFGEAQLPPPADAEQLAQDARSSESEKRVAAVHEAEQRKAESYADRVLAQLRVEGERPSALSDTGPRIALQMAAVGLLLGLAVYGVSQSSQLALWLLALALAGGGYSRYRRPW
ncbi:MAG TPA: hypothetical protein VMR50_11725 [Myxococcota bacterium]|nr:hypothetical protein [Myxococcota bacterium]